MDIKLMEKIVFLDRDGVINVDKGYVHKIKDFEFIPGAIDAMKYLQELGYKLAIVSNQSGIARGYYTLRDYNKLMDWVQQELAEAGVFIFQMECCPHMPDAGCRCRKPNAGMLQKVKENIADSVSHRDSWIIGDKDSDILCGRGYDLKTIRIHKKGQLNSPQADYIIDSLADIKTIIK